MFRDNWPWVLLVGFARKGLRRDIRVSLSFLDRRIFRADAKEFALSDGMGSGEEAFRDSTMVVEMLERTAGSRISGRDSGADDEYGAGKQEGRSEVLYIGLSVCLIVSGKL